MTTLIADPNNPLGLYEGCYVILRNGMELGPIEKRPDIFSTTAPWQCRGVIWYADGRYDIHDENDLDVVRVLTFSEIAHRLGSIQQADTPTAEIAIPPHVLAAAREAGLKAVPAYEEFVEAIVRAAFQSQYAVVLNMAVKTLNQSRPAPSITVEEIRDVMCANLPIDAPFDQRPKESQEVIMRCSNALMALLESKDQIAAPAEKHNFKIEPAISEKPEVEPNRTAGFTIPLDLEH